ncbi:MAG: TolC family protein [Phycisphaerae bacterium]|nr:TolC family protein [Phycisphaerae bacterium]
MRKLRATICGLTLVAAGPVLLGGCKSREEFTNDVGLSRQAAYRQWENRKTQEESQQPRISGKLSVEDCVKLTLAHNKMLQQTLEERTVAEGQVVGSRSAYLPNVALSTQYRRDELVPSFDIPGPGGTTEHVQIGTLNSYSAGLTVTQPLYAGGAITAQVRAAKLFSLLTDQTIRAATQDVVYATETAYYNLLLSQHLVDISTDAVHAAKVHLDDVEKKRAGGVASNFDVLRAQVELSNFKADLIRSKNAINIARANLIKTMGVSQDSDFVLSDKFAYAPIEVSMEQAVQTAFTNRPDLYSREYQIRQQREQLKIARSRYLPNASAYFTNTWASPSPSSFGSSSSEWGRIWQAGVQGAWPIFDGFQREGNIIQQKARLKQAQIGLVDAEETAVFELTQAILSMENAEEFVQSQKLNLTRATEGLRLAQVGYEQGINTQVEVIDAQSALTTARVNYYQSIYSHVVAKLAVQRAMGTIVSAQTLDSPEAEKTQDSGRKTEDGKQGLDSSQSNPPSQEGSKKE